MPSHRAPLRQWAPYAGYPQRVVDKALRLLRARKNNSELTYRVIAHLCRVPSPETIRRWASHSMSAPARAERSAQKGPARALTIEEEHVAAGWVRMRHGMLLDTSSTRFFQFISRAFGKSPSKAWLVRFKRRWQLSSRLGRSQYPGSHLRPPSERASNSWSVCTQSTSSLVSSCSWTKLH